MWSRRRGPDIVAALELRVAVSLPLERCNETSREVARVRVVSHRHDRRDACSLLMCLQPQPRSQGGVRAGRSAEKSEWEYCRFYRSTGEQKATGASSCLRRVQAMIDAMIPARHAP